MMGKVHTAKDSKCDISLPEPYRIAQGVSFNAELSAAERTASLVVMH
jgi:hypothetical protein